MSNVRHMATDLGIDSGNGGGKPGRRKRDRTLADALSDEMARRGHSQSDAAAEMQTSQANVSRWLDRVSPTVPDFTSTRSADNVHRIVQYLGLTNLSEYATLALNAERESLLIRNPGFRDKHPRP